MKIAIVIPQRNLWVWMWMLICLISTPIFSQEPSAEDTTDILAEVIAMQANMPAPSTNFRPGHVSTRSIENYLTTEKSGFTIQLPKRSLTPSPTIYKGMLFSGGGFGSKEFYAFDAKTGEVKWALDLDDDGPSSAVVVDDIVVFNTESCTIFALNAFTGEYLWSYFLGDPLMSTPSIGGGLVFTAYPASGRGVAPGGGSYQNTLPIQNYPPNVQQQQPQVIPNTSPASPDEKEQEEKTPTKNKLRATHVMIAMELKTGKIVWQQWIDGDIMSAPVLEGDEVFVSTFPGTLYKFNRATGELLSANATRATSAPVLAGNSLYVSRRSDQGEEDEVRESLSVWNPSVRGASSSLYDYNAVYLDERVQNQSALKQQATSYDAGNGFTAGAPAVSGWEQASKNIGQSNVSSLQGFQGSRILHVGGRNYATMGDQIVCTQSGSGEVLWKKDLKGDLKKEGGFLATPPAYVQGKILTANLNGEVLLSDATTGEELKRYQVDGKVRFQPVVDQGRIYVSTMEGKIICIDTGDPTFSGWPTWGANPAHTNKN